MGLLILASLLLSTALSLVSGSPRALLARDGLGPARVSRDEIWDQIPRFRRIWRVCTVIWLQPS
jgi:hypothetical protein